MGIGAAFSAFAGWFHGLVNDVLGWLKGLFEYAAAWVLDQVLGAAATVFEAIPVPEAFAEVGPAWGQAVSAAGFFLEPWHIGEGLTMFFGALAIRFLLRRIPVIG
jgi:hypothetical protein